MAMASFGPQYAAYGATPSISMPQQKSEGGLKTFEPRQRSRMSVRGACANLFLPWLLFVILYADVSFSLHFYAPFLCWLIAALGVIVSMVIGVLAAIKVKDLTKNNTNPLPVWLVFLFLTSLFAALGGILLGNLNYWENMQPFYDLQTLNIYSHVNPLKNHGRQIMDAGIAAFVPNATLDLKKAYKFEDDDTYCVTPISVKNATTGNLTALPAYDFWAVGLNCCGVNRSHVVDYRCGAYRSTTARMGARLLTENQRAFYRLAVQQAEAAHKIKSNYPIFFYWTEDAFADRDSYGNFGMKYFLIGILFWFLLQVLLMLWTGFFVSKAGF